MLMSENNKEVLATSPKNRSTSWECL